MLVRWRAAAILVAVTVGLVPAHPRAAGGGGTTRIVYFDPDANQKAILRIAAEFNAYLQTQGLAVTLQPVDRVEPLNELLRDSDTKFAIISSQFVSSAHASAPLVPVLVPEASGRTSYVKELLDDSRGEAGDLRGKRIAVTSVGDANRRVSEELLTTLRSAGIKVDNTVVVPVSKDIDALLALSFAQVSAAVVTSESVRVLARVNPQATAHFRKLYETPPILRSPLCEVRGRTLAEERDKIIAAFSAMSRDEGGRSAMQSMGIERWVPFEKEMLTR